MLAYIILFITYIAALIFLSYGYLIVSMTTFAAGLLFGGIYSFIIYIKDKNVNKN